jgi:hypothetical protein
VNDQVVAPRRESPQEAEFRADPREAALAAPMAVHDVQFGEARMQR